MHARADKIAGIAKELAPVEADDPSGEAKVLMVGWGSTYAAITAGVKRVRKAGRAVAQLHLVHINPFPPKLGEVLRSYEVVIVPENNLGHLTRLLRADFLVDAKVMAKVQGTPFRVGEIEQAINDAIDGLDRALGSTPTSNGSCGPQRQGDRAMTDVAVPVTTRKDWASDQEVRWCPGCGDYTILSAVQLLLPELGVRRENTVFISGIGCAARFPYYMNTYGMHSIHGRAPAIATGLAVTRPDLDVWVVTGDGDALSIGGNHLVHCLAAQREADDPHVQQPDLRPHQGPVLADLRGRQDHQVDPVRLARHAL